MNKFLEEAGNSLINRDYKVAIEFYYKALAEEEEDKVFILTKIAQCYMLLNNYDKAIYNYEKVTELDPNNIDNYISLAKIYETKSECNQKCNQKKFPIFIE